MNRVQWILITASLLSGILLNAGCDLTDRYDVRGTWTFSGSVVIEGDNSKLSLQNGGSLFIEDGSNLTLKNLKIENVHDTNIGCSSASSTLILSGVNLTLDSNFSFTAGSLSFQNRNIVSGGYEFNYDSDQTSTINSNALWGIHDDVTLSIGKKYANSSIQPLYFE